MVTTASGRKAVFPPLVSFDNTLTVSHSAAANQVTVQYLFWNYEKKKKKES